MLIHEPQSQKEQHAALVSSICVHICQLACSCNLVHEGECDKTVPSMD